MGSYLYKDVVDTIYTKGFEIPDRIGPVKYDAFDSILRSYQVVLPAIAQRIDSIEQHLEAGEGKAFIRSQERPDVGHEAVHALTEQVRQLGQRLEKLEARGK